ncbi:iron complex transport system substrate-binding protein [Alkalispirochaeta americana]|uniref:Iron complex transport system substrate-binding protein n=2 Tax=Alkalispirochaeta americana TaxID=159291 RepID=A0A1N6S4T9_9SPIO|nr:iron complex transport system substrate-binding protein [Alkalispirochaeta americana]
MCSPSRLARFFSFVLAFAVLAFAVLTFAVLAQAPVVAADSVTRAVAPEGHLSGVAPIKEAANLRITRKETHQEVRISNAWPGAPDLIYFLVPRGTDPGNIDGPPGTVIAVPPRRVVSLSTPNIPFIRDLGELSSLVGVDTADYVYDETVRQALEQGTVRTTGAGAQLDLERLLALRPDVVLLSAYSPDDPALRRLEGAGVPSMVIADWREPTPLGRAEWLRLFGALYGKEALAEELFSHRARRYHDLARRTDQAIRQGARPEVFANAPWQGQWPVPAGESYLAMLFADAGARYLWADTRGAGSLFLDLEAVLARARDADVWMHLNATWSSPEDIRREDPRLTLFRAFREGRVYHHDRRQRSRGANDFWETGVGRPDLLLEDLVTIFHPQADLVPGHQLRFYRSIFP